MLNMTKCQKNELLNENNNIATEVLKLMYA